MKRLFDIVVSALILIIVSPIFLVVIPLLRFTGEGEVFYVQKRIGLGNSRFGLCKFVTMLKDSPKSGFITAKDDPRVLPVGRYLRRAKINELPQLLNVFKGDMSIVGPRPLVEQTFQYYATDVQKVILKMKPGLTGLGSLVFRSEEEILCASEKGKMRCYAEEIAPLKGELECWYFEQRGFLMDLKIIVATAVSVVAPGSNFFLGWFPIADLLRSSSLAAFLLGNPR